MGPRRPTAYEYVSSFWDRVDVRDDDECWPWTGNTDAAGYGKLSWDARPEYAHRVSLLLSCGDWPKGRRQVVMHSCDNPGCVNPRHLSIGSQSENLRQASRRGRSGAARGSRQAFAKLNEDDVNSIVMAVRLGAKQKDIADEFGVHATTISKIMRGASWKHVEG